MGVNWLSVKDSVIRTTSGGITALLATMTLVAACAHTQGRANGQAPLAPGAKYIAMGSSYAAGPGVSTYVDADPAPCYRSNDNYARQLSRRLGLVLTDVSCSGATTHDLLEPYGNLPPQLDAVNADTRLVTVTIGGNDLGYVARLVTASCAGLAAETNTAADCRPIPAPPQEADYKALKARMDRVAKTVRARAPQARLVFVDYPTVLPAGELCPEAPLSMDQAAIVRDIARRLSDITRQAAADNGASLIVASNLSRDHSVCAADPWMNGYPRPGAPVKGTQFHPNLEGMTAVANALELMLEGEAQLAKPAGERS